MRALFRTCASIAVSVLTAAACGQDGTEVRPPTSTPPSSHHAFLERELARDPHLRARLSSTIVLDLEPPHATVPEHEDTGVRGVDVVPYAIDAAQRVHFCLGEKADAIGSVELVASDGTKVMTLRPSDPAARCVPADVTPGEYRLEISHAGSTDDATPKLLFVHAALESSASGCSPASQRMDPGDFPDSVWHVVDGNGARIAATPSGLRYEPNKAGAADPSRGVSFVAGDPPRRIGRADSGFLAVDGGFVVSRTDGDAWHLVSTAKPWSFFVMTEPPGSTTFAWYAPRTFDADGTAALPATSLTGGSILPVTFAARRAPADRVGELKAGEVALFSECNFQGIAWVVNEANAFPSILSLPGLEQGPKSVKLGCDASLLTWAGPIPFMPTTFDADVACDPPGSFESARVRRRTTVVVDIDQCVGCDLSNKDLSGKNLDGAQLILTDLSNANLSGASAKRMSCSQCTFTGTDLSGATLDGATFTGVPRSSMQGSIWRETSCVGCQLSYLDLSGADMTRARLDGTRLMRVDLDRANLDGTRLVGVTFIEAALTNMDLRNADFGAAPDFQPYPGDTIAASPCTDPPTDARLSTLLGSTFRPSQIPPAVWRNVVLDGATIDATGGSAEEADLDEADLCGLRASRTSFVGLSIRNARFDRSRLDRASLVNLDLRGTSFKGATITGASFVYSDMRDVDFERVTGDGWVDDPSSGSGSGLYLSTNFKGTLFAPKSLVNARLGRANFSSATVLFPPAPLRAGLQITDATFAGADLSGSDMSGIVAPGGDFSNVTFLGVDLTSAQLGSSESQPSTFAGATFCGATLGGTVFDGARSLSGALFPTSTTQVIDRSTKDATVCSPVKIAGDGPITSAVSTKNVPICPNDRAPTSSEGCTDADFVVDPTISGSRLVCPGPDEHGVMPTRLRACRPCTSDCDCSSLLCTRGVCSYCAED